ncbi:MAG: uroporphyrinogen decarboxylase [Acidimicrobiia bacterium]
MAAARPSDPSIDDPLASAPPLLRAARGLPVDRVPVWFMRQAGRSLPEYRAVRGEGSILDAIHDPELSAEITLQPVRRYGVDAAILYSDIVVPAHAVGFGVDVTPGVGPVVTEPFRSAADLDRLRPYEPSVDAPYVGETVRLVVQELGDATPLIGFAGAPFTVASYLVEGRPSRTYGKTKALMHGEPDLWRELLDRLADMAIASLLDQIGHGARAIQLFDSWAGALPPDVYEELVLPASAKVFEAVAGTGVPRIHFGVGTGELLPLMGAAGADVVGVDWRVPLDVARTRLPGKAVQGNLDPAVCLAPWEVVAERTRDVLARNGGRPGHIFNLGHGVLPELDPGVLKAVVDLVHEEGHQHGSRPGA